MNRLLQFFRTPIGRYLMLGIVLIVIGWGYLRGCSPASHFIHPRYNIAVDGSWYPLPLYGKERNLLAFTDDLLEAITQESGLRFNLVEVGTPNLLQDLDNKTYDGIISALPPTPQNMFKYLFSEPLYLVGPVLVVKAGSDIKSLEELSGKFVGIRRGVSLAFDVPFPKANIIPYDNMSIALSDLERHGIDALIMDSMQAYLQIQGIYTGTVKIATRPLTREGVRLIAHKNERAQEFFEMFNKSLMTLKENGTYVELLNRWGLFNPLIQESIKI